MGFKEITEEELIEEIRREWTKAVSKWPVFRTPIITTPKDLDKHFMVADFSGGDYRIDPVSTRCDHDLRDYNGFTESYKYCTKCSHKEQL